ncbi:MAG: addiction module protein [Gemmatales bacterium]
MSKAAQDMLVAIRALPESDQEEIMIELMESLGPNDGYESEEEFAAELRRRIDDIESGRVKPIPREVALKMILDDVEVEKAK